jgi:WD40 repeat protein
MKYFLNNQKTNYWCILENIIYHMKSYITLLLLLYTLITNSQPNKPILRIETGIHTSKGNKISTDASGKLLLTVSNDKTARLWDAATGILLKTLRIPISNSIYEGTLYAGSLHPNGKIAAVSGYTGYEWDKNICIYLINTQTGAIIHRIKGIPNIVNELEFSPDGNWMAAGLSDNGGVYIYDTKGWGEYKKLSGYTGTTNKIAFKPGGGLATLSSDGKLKLYNSSFELIKEKMGQTGLVINSMAFNPVFDVLAIGFRGAPHVELLNASDLSLQNKATNTTGDGTDFGMISFSADGNKLYGGGNKYIQAENRWKQIVRCWNNAGNGIYSDLLYLNNTIADIKPMADGSMAVLGFDPPEIAVIDPTNKIRWHAEAEKNDFTGRDKSHFRVNENGTSIGFTPLNYQAISFDLTKRNLVDEESLFPAPVDANSGTVVQDWNRNWNPVINGKKFPEFGKRFQECLSTDISNNGDLVVFGSSWDLILSDKNAGVIWATQTETHPFAVNLSGNEKVVAAAFADGTIRWFRKDNGKHILTFYLLPDKKKWVLFTPGGYYDASPGAEEFLGWHLNNGPDEAPSFYPVSRFKDKFYRPDIINAVLETYNEEDAIVRANERSIKDKTVHEAVTTDIRQKLPPTITINSPVNGSVISNNTVSISYAIKSPEDAPVKNLRVLVDGRPVPTERGKVLASASEKIDVTVPSQNCTITLLAENDNGTSPETNLYLKWENAVVKSDEFIYKPKLYVLAIGVSDYNNPDLKLVFAAKDAGDFTDAIYKQKGNL